jgi:hypothetical protein
MRVYPLIDVLVERRGIRRSQAHCHVECLQQPIEVRCVASRPCSNNRDFAKRTKRRASRRQFVGGGFLPVFRKVPRSGGSLTEKPRNGDRTLTTVAVP